MTNTELVKIFEQTIRQKPFSLSENTIKTYLYHIDSLLKFLDNKNIAEITTKDIKKYLFNISSEAEYRLVMELNTAFDKMVADPSDANEAIYKIDDSYSISTLGGKFTVINSNGNVLSEVSAEQFAKSPRIAFNRIKNVIKG